MRISGIAGLILVCGLMVFCTINHARSEDITVTAPTQGTVWTAGGTYNITWTGPAIPACDLQVQKTWDEAQGYSLIATVARGKYFYTWTIPTNIPPLISSNIRIRIMECPGRYGVSAPFTIKK